MPAPTALAMPQFHPFVGIDVPWLLRERARTHGDRPYLIWDPFEGEGRSYTYAEFARAVERLAPFTKDMNAGGGRAAAYVCSEGACLSPVASATGLIEALKESPGVSRARPRTRR